MSQGRPRYIAKLLSIDENCRPCIRFIRSSLIPLPSSFILHPSSFILMRFPLSLTTSLTGYLLKQKISGRKQFPLVLMLEPLHACNLTCTGCGRIREYAATIRAAHVGGRLPGLGRRMRRTGGQRLRRRTAGLRGDRRTGCQAGRAEEARLRLHQRRCCWRRSCPAFDPVRGCSSTCISTAWRPRTTGWSSARAALPPRWRASRRPWPPVSR